MDYRRQGLLLVLSGPSGVGKGTICKEVVSGNLNIVVSVSATTRPQRKNEVEGVSYFFKSKEEFASMTENGEFLEYITGFDGMSYGTPREFVFDHLNKGRDVILEIDVEGGLKIKQMYNEAVLIFIAPPSMEELRHRLVERGTQSAQSIDVRTKKAYEELAAIPDYDYIIVNNTISEACEGVRSIMHSEKSKVARNMDLISRLAKK